MYIYIHIPFCSSICSYCDFPKVLYDKKYIRKYLETLEKEIKTRYKNEMVKTIYIGGGTPTSLDIAELEILMKITDCFNKEESIEFSIEANIEGLDIEKIRLLKQYGVNRISLGVQSFQDDILRELNRKHTKEDVYRLISNLKKNGFDNISIDYIYGINSNIDIIKKDIDSFLELDIPHISSYALIIEEGTVFGINNRRYIEDDKEEEMYLYIKNKLESNGYLHYEISNYAKDGYQSIHNINYWENGIYYGFGMGAVSYIDNYRISNTRSLTKYINGEYLLSSDYEDEITRISNTFMLGLRMIKGIDIIKFKNRYNKDILEILNVKKLINDGKLILDGNYLYIADKYFYLSNEIIIELI